MNNEDIYDGITDIRDDLIEGAARKRRTRRRWTSALAAMLALAVLLGVALRPDAGSSGMSASAFALAEAEYPEMPPYPSEEEYIDPISGEWDDKRFEEVYEPWWESQLARWRNLPEDYGAGLEDFFAAGIRQFLTGGAGENRVYSR